MGVGGEAIPVTTAADLTGTGHSNGPTTREKIVASALAAFRKRGYQAATLQEIAEELGITRAAVLYHFGSKAELLGEVVEPYLARLEALVASANLADPPSAAQCQQLLADVLELTLRHAPVVDLLLRDVSTNRQLSIGRRTTECGRTIRRQLVGSNATTTDRIRAAAAFAVLTAPPSLLTDVEFGRYREAVLQSAVAALRVPSGE